MARTDKDQPRREVELGPKRVTTSSLGENFVILRCLPIAAKRKLYEIQGYDLVYWAWDFGQFIL